MRPWSLDKFTHLTENEFMRTNLSELKSFLNSEWSIKNYANSKYSKRAFARDLGISPTVLNDFLSGKRDLSFKNVDTVFRYLNKKAFCSWCDKPQKKTKYLIGGPRRQFICDTCIETCLEIVRTGKRTPQVMPLPTCRKKKKPPKILYSSFKFLGTGCLTNLKRLRRYLISNFEPRHCNCS
jgi:hypothetical protein